MLRRSDPPQGRGGAAREILVIVAFAWVPLLLAIWLAPLRVGHPVQPNPYVLLWCPLSLLPLVLLSVLNGRLERRMKSRAARFAAVAAAAAAVLLVLELAVRLFGGWDTVSQARDPGPVRWLHDSGFSYSAAEPLVLATAAQLQVLLAPFTTRILDWAMKA